MAGSNYSYLEDNEDEAESEPDEVADEEVLDLDSQEDEDEEEEEDELGDLTQNPNFRKVQSKYDKQVAALKAENDRLKAATFSEQSVAPELERQRQQAMLEMDNIQQEAAAAQQAGDFQKVRALERRAVAVERAIITVEATIIATETGIDPNEAEYVRYVASGQVEDWRDLKVKALEIRLSTMSAPNAAKKLAADKKAFAKEKADWFAAKSSERLKMRNEERTKVGADQIPGVAGAPTGKKGKLMRMRDEAIKRNDADAYLDIQTALAELG